VALDLYGPIIGYALVVLIVAVTAWLVLRKGSSDRRDAGYASSRLPHEVQTILNGFQDSIEASLAEAQKAAKIGEAVVAAAKPIELALRDFEQRITELQSRADATESRSAELKSALGEGEKSLAGHGRAIERIDVLQDGFSQQLTAAIALLSSLKPMVDSALSRHKETDEQLRAINNNLAAIQAQLDGLPGRVDVVEKGQARLSALTQSLSQSVGALKAVADETAQRISALESRLLWRIEALETLANSAQAAADRPSSDDAEDIPRWR